MENDQLNFEMLGSYLEKNITGFLGLIGAEKFSDGQSNPTFLLTAATGRYVLRSQPLGELLKSAHAVDREFKVIRALKGSDVPVARADHLCEDPSIIGSMFYVMSYEEGRIFWNPALPGSDNAERMGIYDEMNCILVALHDVDVNAAGLGDFGRRGNYFKRQLNRWTVQYKATETEPIPAMDRLMKWLPANLPADDGMVSLNHGDFRLDNIIFHPNKPKAKAVLDWELSTLGHPYADLAYQCMQLRLAPDAAIPGLGGLDRKLLGIPTEEEYIATYCARRGISKILHWDFYLAFSFFRLAAILQGVLKRAIDGNASSQNAFEYGGLAPTLAEMAVKLIERDAHEQPNL
jgi:aminoglycoside phosphotransferase (APT) family kinase protein